jgi:hypothetical protein
MQGRLGMSIHVIVRSPFAQQPPHLGDITINRTGYQSHATDAVLSSEKNNKQVESRHGTKGRALESAKSKQRELRDIIKATEKYF